MNFLADENVDRQIVERLRQEGHTVIAVVETSRSVTDPYVLAEANRSGSVLLTADKDFGELVFRQRLTFGGIVLLRLAGVAPDAKAEIVASVVRGHGHELAGAFSVVGSRALRIRRRESMN